MYGILPGKYQPRLHNFMNEMAPEYTYYVVIKSDFCNIVILGMPEPV